jgi:hypothetical protein
VDLQNCSSMSRDDAPGLSRYQRYYRANREAMLERARKYYVENSERERKRLQQFYFANREHILERKRAAYSARATAAKGRPDRADGEDTGGSAKART